MLLLLLFLSLLLWLMLVVITLNIITIIITFIIIIIIIITVIIIMVNVFSNLYYYNCNFYIYYQWGSYQNDFLSNFNFDFFCEFLLIHICFYSFPQKQKQKFFFWRTTMEIKPHSFFVLSLPSHLVFMYIYSVFLM